VALEEKEPGLHNWERKLLIFAFGTWAAVVGFYGQAAVNRVDRIAASMEQDRKDQITYQNQMERRVLLLEFEQRQFRQLLLKETKNGLEP